MSPDCPESGKLSDNSSTVLDASMAFHRIILNYLIETIMEALHSLPTFLIALYSLVYIPRKRRSH